MGAFLRRLESGAGGWPAQAGLRLGGALLLGGCALAVWALIVSIHRPPLHDADPAEFGEAVLSVIAWALGWALLVEGPGLFRLIPVPPGHVRFDNGRRHRRQEGKKTMNDLIWLGALAGLFLLTLACVRLCDQA